MIKRSKNKGPSKQSTVQMSLGEFDTYLKQQAAPNIYEDVKQIKPKKLVSSWEELFDEPPPQ